MNEQEREHYLKDREDDIINGYQNIDFVLGEVWDEAQRQAASIWQPIETAPKDGTWILLASKDDDEGLAIQSGFWGDGFYYGWRDFKNDSCGIGGFEPTHWMPLPPEPPTTPKPLSEELVGVIKILVDSGLDTEYAEAIEIICRAAVQLQKQEQANEEK